MGLLSKIGRRLTSRTAGTFAAKFMRVRLEGFYDDLANRAWMRWLQGLSPGKQVAVETTLHATCEWLESVIAKDSAIIACLRTLIGDVSSEIIGRVRKPPHEAAHDLYWHLRTVDATGINAVYRQIVMDKLALLSLTPQELERCVGIACDARANHGRDPHDVVIWLAGLNPDTRSRIFGCGCEAAYAAHRAMPVNPFENIKSFVKREIAGLGRLTNQATEALRESAARDQAQLRALKEGRT